MTRNTPKSFKQRMQDRYARRNVYGVPVSVLSPDEMEKRSDSGMSGDAFWMRPVQALTQQDFGYIAKAVYENFVTKTPETRRLTDKREIMQTVSHYVEKIYTDWQMFKSGAGGGSYTITWPVMDSPDKLADAQGKQNYAPRETAIVVHKPAAGAEEEIAGFTGLDVTQVADTGLDTDAWNWFMLEHELAHVAGAGEAQADAVAAARYMKETGKDDVPRKLMQVRSIMAVVQAMERVAIDEAPQRLSPRELAQMGLNNKAQRDAHVAETMRYGWGPVASLADRIAAGAGAHQAMDEDAIAEIPFTPYDKRNDDLTALIHEIEKRDAGYNFYTPDFVRLVRVMDEIAAGPDSVFSDLAATFSKAVRDVIKPEAYAPAQSQSSKPVSPVLS